MVLFQKTDRKLDKQWDGGPSRGGGMGNNSNGGSWGQQGSQGGRPPMQGGYGTGGPSDSYPVKNQSWGGNSNNNNNYQNHDQNQNKS